MALLLSIMVYCLAKIVPSPVSFSFFKTSFCRNSITHAFEAMLQIESHQKILITARSAKFSLENLKNITSFTRFFEERYVQVTSIRKRMGLAQRENGNAGITY